MWWRKSTSEAAKALFAQIAPEISRLVREEVKRSLAEDAQIRLAIAGATEDYLEKTYNQVLGLKRANTEMLDTLRNLLDDYDGLNGRITRLSERVDKLSEGRDID